MTNSNPTRIPPLAPSEWNQGVLEALGAFPAGLNFVLKSRADGEDLPRGANVLGALAHHPALARAFLTFNAHVATASQLTARTRELIILRISWLKHSEYEFAQHLILARRAGLSEDELSKIQLGADAGNWSPEDAAVLHAMDELHLHSRIGDATWARLQQLFTAQQLMDLLFMAGCYATLAMVLNSIGLSLEPSAPVLDDDTRRRLHRPNIIQS